MEAELRDFGLSDNEIEVYLALLKTGISTANRIAELTGIKRSTCYDTLRLLVSKGIISTHIRDDKNYFEAAPPQKIVDILKYKEERIEKILPELEQLRGVIPERSAVSFFQGKNGVIAVLNEILDTGDSFLFYGSRKKSLKALAHYPENFIQKRAEKGINLRAVLAEEDRVDTVYKMSEIKKLSKLRFSEDLNNIDAIVFIYGTKVAFLSCGEDLAGIIIESPSILKQQQQIFAMLWQNAAK